jgi:hypothetical protein
LPEAGWLEAGREGDPLVLYVVALLGLGGRDIADRLPATAPLAPYMILHHRIAAAIAMLVAQGPGKAGEAGRLLKPHRVETFKRRRLIGLIWMLTFGGMQWRIAGWLSGVPFTTLHSSFARWTRLRQAENHISSWKTHLAADRTSCHRASANQLRLMLHTGAYWLMWSLRRLMSARSSWRVAQFDTLRLRLVKIAARVVRGRTP